MATCSESEKASRRGFLAEIWFSLDVNLKRLILVGFVQIFSVNLYVTVLMPYYRSLGFGSETAGFLGSVVQVSGAVVSVVAGYLADSLGRKRMYMAGHLLRCLVAGLLMITRNYVGLFVISLIRGMGMVQAPAENALLGSLTQKGSRATVLGVTQTIAQLASVVAPLLSGYVADRFGVMTSFGSGLVLACLTVAIAMPIKVADPVQDEDVPSVAGDEGQEGEARPSQVERVSVAQRTKRMFTEGKPIATACLMGVAILNGLGNGVFGIALPFTIMDRFSSAYSAVSSASAAASLGTMLVLLIGGRIADRSGRRGIILTTVCIEPFMHLGLFMAGSLWQLLTFLILTTMIGNSASPAMNAVLLEAVPDRDRATFMGLWQGLNSAGVALGALAAGVAYGLSPAVTRLAPMVLFAMQFPLYAIAIPRKKPD